VDAVTTTVPNQRITEPSGWHGRYSKGAMRQRRAVKRVEAEERNERTAPERRSQKKALRLATGSAR
jgi:hypothetical protein